MHAQDPAIYLWPEVCEIVPCHTLSPGVPSVMTDKMCSCSVASVPLAAKEDHIKFENSSNDTV